MLDTILTMAREKFWRLDIIEEPCPSIIEASTGLYDATLHFKLDTKAEENLLAIDITREEQKVLARGLVQHEIGHWNVCPFNSDGQYLLVEPITQVVKDRLTEAGPREIESYTRTLANIVSDIIVDTVLAWEDNTSAYADAQALFFLKELLRSQSFSPLYDVFVRLNLELWKTRATVADRLISYLPADGHSGKVDKALSLFPHLEEKWRLTSWLRDRSNWQALSKGLAEIFVDLIERPTQTWWRASPFRDILSVLYEGRAKGIKLALEGNEGEPIHLPILPLLCQPVDAVRPPPLERLVWAQTRCLPEKSGRHRLQLYQAEVTLEVSLPPIRGHGFLPDLAFFVDSSGSMSYAPYDGKGDYDLLLRTIFGVFQWLKNQNMAAYLRYAVLNFSNRSLYSGWKEWRQIEAVYETLFHYQGGMTRLNIKLAERLVRESRGSFAAIMVTDGEVAATSALVNYVTTHFGPPNGFILIQVGGMTELALSLMKRGYKVHVVRNHWELKDLVLGEVRERYDA